MNKAKKLALAAATGASLFAGSAMAAVDTTEITTAITAAGVAIAAVGGAVLVMKVGGKVWKWIGSFL